MATNINFNKFYIQALWTLIVLLEKSKTWHLIGIFALIIIIGFLLAIFI